MWRCSSSRPTSEHPPAGSTQHLKTAKHTETILSIEMLIFEEFPKLFERKTPSEKPRKIEDFGGFSPETKAFASL